MSKDEEGKEGVWRTIRGRRVFIRKGEDLEEAMKRSGKFSRVEKNKDKYKDIDDNSTYVDSKIDDLEGKHINKQQKEWSKEAKELEKDMKNSEYYKNMHKEELETEDKEKDEYKPEQRKLTSEDIKSMSNEELQDTYNKMLSNYYSDSNFYDHGTENMLEEIKNEMDSRPSDWRDQVKANNEQLEKDLEEYKNTHNMAYQEDGYYELFRENERRNAKIKQELPNEKYEPLEAYATYKEKRNKLEGLTENSDGSTNWDNYKDAEWTGKEYTNDEFLENLEDENWHTERKMLLDAGLTNKQMEFVKNNTTFHNGSPSLDKEITTELIKGAKGQSYRTPEQILSKRKTEAIKKVSADLKTASVKGTGGMSTTYDSLKERYKALTGKDYDDSNIEIPYDSKKEYRDRAGKTINQDMIRENTSGWSAEKVKSEIEREKSFLMNYGPEDREINNAYIKEMEKYYNGMEKYESRISDDYGTKDWKDGYGSRMGGSSWKGTKSGENLTTTEIAKTVTDKMKEAYPGIKIGRKTNYFSGGSSADFSIMESDKPLIRNISDFSDSEISKLYNSGYNSNYYKSVEEFKDNLSKELSSGHYSVNKYNVEDDYRLTPYGKQVIRDLNKVSDAYNFDDSDSMTDYFHTGFYSDISIGKYNKPYIVKDKEIKAKVERYKKRKNK